MSTILDHFLTRSRTVIGISSLAVAATAMAGCGATTTGGSSSIPSLSVGGGTTPSASPGATSGQLGDTLVMEDAGDDVAHVTLLKVFDSATGFDPNTSPPDGTRWVGFEGTIVIDGSRSGEDSTSVDVIGSDGQTYGADTAYHLSTFDGCTATGIDVSPGQTQTFCAGVGLPPGVTVAKVGYSTEGVDGHAPGGAVLDRGGFRGLDADGHPGRHHHADSIAIGLPHHDRISHAGRDADVNSDDPMTGLVERWKPREGWRSGLVRRVWRRRAQLPAPPRSDAEVHQPTDTATGGGDISVCSTTQ